MKKLVAILFLAVTFSNAQAQDIQMKGDTIVYGKAKFYAGKEIRLGYGSTATKDFAFIKIGDVMTSIQPLKAFWAKEKETIERVYQSGNNYIILCKVSDNRSLYIMTEQAIDNKELVE